MRDRRDVAICHNGEVCPLYSMGLWSASAPDENIDIAFPVQVLNSHLKEQAYPIV